MSSLPSLPPGISDPFKAIGLDPPSANKPSYTEADFRRAYRRRALQFHPDKNPDDKNAEVRFSELTLVLEFLTCSEARDKYVASLLSAEAARVRVSQLSVAKRKYAEDLERREDEATGKRRSRETEREAARREKQFRESKATNFQLLKEAQERERRALEELTRRQEESAARGVLSPSSTAEDVDLISEATAGDAISQDDTREFYLLDIKWFWGEESGRFGVADLSRVLQPFSPYRILRFNEEKRVAHVQVARRVSALKAAVALTSMGGEAQGNNNRKLPDISVRFIRRGKPRCGLAEVPRELKEEELGELIEERRRKLEEKKSSAKSAVTESQAHENSDDVNELVNVGSDVEEGREKIGADKDDNRYTFGGPDLLIGGEKDDDGHISEVPSRGLLVGGRETVGNSMLGYRPAWRELGESSSSAAEEVIKEMSDEQAKPRSAVMSRLKQFSALSKKINKAPPKRRIEGSQAEEESLSRENESRAAEIIRQKEDDALRMLAMLEEED